MQNHLYDKTQPENIGFLKRFRALLDQYEGRTTVGEVGDGARSLQTVAAYTSGGDKLHMCYTFDLLGPDFTPEHFRRCVERFPGERHRRLGLLGFLQSRRQPSCQPLCADGGRAATCSPSWRFPLLSAPCAARSVSIRARNWACPRRNSPSRIFAIPTVSASGRPSRAATDAARRCLGRRAACMPASPRRRRSWLPVPYPARSSRRRQAGSGCTVPFFTTIGETLAFRKA